MDSDEVRRQWAERSGAYSPDYYAYHGADERSEAVRERLDGRVNRDARVLELGCSSGRHLAHLATDGYENLAGIELNDEAFAVMADAYPDLAATGTFYCAAIEDVVGEFEDGAFDAVYSVETLQHIHADAAWVFEEIARITDTLLVTVENEGDAADTGEVNAPVDTGEAYETDYADESNTIADAGEVNDADYAGEVNDADDAGEVNDPAEAGDTGVNYVDGGIPLYYRDWNRVFTGLGFTEVDAEVGSRDVVRTFRSGTGYRRTP